MKIKTFFTILITASLTLLLFQNSEPIQMKFLWLDFNISKLLLIIAVFVIGLIVGLLWGAPGLKIENGETENGEFGTSELDEEDKEWLNEEK